MEMFEAKGSGCPECPDVQKGLVVQRVPVVQWIPVVHYALVVQSILVALRWLIVKSIVSITWVPSLQKVLRSLISLKFGWECHWSIQFCWFLLANIFITYIYVNQIPSFPCWQFKYSLLYLLALCFHTPQNRINTTNSITISSVTF